MTENAGRGEGLAGLVAQHEPQLYCPKGPVSGINGTYTIAFHGCSCGWNSDGEASKTEKWSEHVIAALEAAAPAGTPAILNAIGICLDALTKDNIGIIKAAIRHQLALATPSPQAPQEQCNAFSPTEQTPSSMATASANLNVADLKPLKDACDRNWEDESPLQIICIAANAIYWRDVELSVLRGSSDYANGFNAGRESLSTPLTPYGERIADCLRTAVEWNDDYMRINKLYGKVDWVEWAKKLLTGNLEKRVPAATQEQPAGSEASEPPFRKVVEWLHQRMAAAQNLPYEEGDVCLECADAVRDELQPLMEAALKLAGSPRKVGEDEAQTFEQWWQAEGARMVRTTHCTGYELMKEAWVAALATPSPQAPSKLPQSFDARDWAKEFTEICATKGITIEQDWMETWFANAIMAGYDHARVGSPRKVGEDAGAWIPCSEALPRDGEIVFVWDKGWNSSYVAQFTTEGWESGGYHAEPESQSDITHWMRYPRKPEAARPSSVPVGEQKQEEGV